MVYRLVPPDIADLVGRVFPGSSPWRGLFDHDRRDELLGRLILMVEVATCLCPKTTGTGCLLSPGS
jgi:hypothetical protein